MGCSRFARAGMESFVFCPADTPEINVREIALQGARVWRVDGLIDDCGRIVGEGSEAAGWFDVSTLKEPYRIEGKKTMGLELAEQLGWELPDVIFYPTGGRVAKDERVVLFNCATGLKYPMPPADRRLDRTKAIDYAALCRSVVKPGLPSVDSAL